MLESAGESMLLLESIGESMLLLESIGDSILRSSPERLRARSNDDDMGIEELPGDDGGDDREVAHPSATGTPTSF